MEDTATTAGLDISGLSKVMMLLIQASDMGTISDLTETSFIVTKQKASKVEVIGTQLGKTMDVSPISMDSDFVMIAIDDKKGDNVILVKTSDVVDTMTEDRLLSLKDIAPFIVFRWMANLPHLVPRRTIYHQDIEVKYLKGKTTMTGQMQVVTVCDTVEEMNHTPRVLNMLRAKVFGVDSAAYKSQNRNMWITKIIKTQPLSKSFYYEKKFQS